eukprot:m.4550 g.4550  ORF g.4550 m.4550 type:complete len:389 (-) comp1402_c0_seq1:229-1395(-)
MASSAIYGAFTLYACGAWALLQQVWARLTTTSPLASTPWTTTSSLSASGAREPPTVLITGATSGIGREAACQLAQRGYRVIVGAQHLADGERLVCELCARYGQDAAMAAPLCLETVNGVTTFCEWADEKNVGALHAVVCNAAVMLVPLTLHDGFEEHVAVNVLGHLNLVRAMLPRLATDAHRKAGRIIVVSSVVQHVGDIDMRWFQHWPDARAHGTQHMASHYSPHAAYAQSKLALQTLALALARKLEEAHVPVHVHAVDPGIVNTPLYRHVHWAVQPLFQALGPLLLRSPHDAARGVVWATVSTDLALAASGGYYAQGKAIPVAATAHRVDLQVIGCTLHVSLDPARHGTVMDRRGSGNSVTCVSAVSDNISTDIVRAVTDILFQSL